MVVYLLQYPLAPFHWLIVKQTGIPRFRRVKEQPLENTVWLVQYHSVLSVQHSLNLIISMPSSW